MLQNIIIHYN